MKARGFFPSFLSGVDWMFTKLLLALILALGGALAVILIRDVARNWQETRQEPGNPLLLGLLPACVQFLGTFGVSDFAINTVVYRRFRLVPDEKLPGTLNVDCGIPVAAMALCYISSVPVELPTLLVCIVAQVIGTYVGVRYVVRLPVEAVRLLMGGALIGSGLLILAGKAGLIPIGGDALGLEPPRLALAAALLALYGGLNAVGFGSTAPSLATLYALGLNPMAAFPVVMGACAVSLSVGAVKFIRSGAYGRKISLLSSLCGVVGVIVAVEVVKGLDVGLLQWLVAGMILYTGFSMLRKELLRRREIRAQA